MDNLLLALDWNKEDSVSKLFTFSGFQVMKLWKLENNYWPKVPEYLELISKNPWWLVKTNFGLIEIGPRKRVVSLNWSETKLRKCIHNETEQRTSSTTFIHCYTMEQLLKDLTNLERELAPL